MKQKIATTSTTTATHINLVDELISVLLTCTVVVIVRASATISATAVTIVLRAAYYLRRLESLEKRALGATTATARVVGTTSAVRVRRAQERLVVRVGETIDVHEEVGRRVDVSRAHGHDLVVALVTIRVYAFWFFNQPQLSKNCCFASLEFRACLPHPPWPPTPK